MKLTKKTVFEVDYNDLDYAITEFLKSKGLNEQYECVPYEEWGNDESHSFNIGKYDFSLPNDAQKKKILSGELNWQTGRILEWMCAEGVIESGEYLINVFW